MAKEKKQPYKVVMTEGKREIIVIAGDKLP